LAVSAFLLGDGEYARRLMDRSVRKAWEFGSRRDDRLRWTRSKSLPARPHQSCGRGGSFELRAALSLAKLYQSTGRPTEAHAILPPAVKGFSPTTQIAAALALI
jgi:hypothetical protein